MELGLYTSRRLASWCLSLGTLIVSSPQFVRLGPQVERLDEGGKQGLLVDEEGGGDLGRASAVVGVAE